MRILSLAAAAALAIGLAGCGGTPAPQPQPEPGATTGTPTPDATTPDASGGPCDVVSADALTEIFGEDLGPGSVRSSSTITVQDVTWHPAECVWDGDDIEVEVAIADAAAFDSGTLTCVAPLGVGKDVQPVGGIGDQAWWEADDSDDDEGLLRACTATHVIDIDVDGDDMDARTAAITLMERVLATL
jgi:hypothetical protein